MQWRGRVDIQQAVNVFLTREVSALSYDSVEMVADIAVGMKIHALYIVDGEFYPAKIVKICKPPTRNRVKAGFRCPSMLLESFRCLATGALQGLPRA